MFDSIRQQIHVSNFETTDLRVCLGAIFKRKAKKQNLCFCLQIIHGYLFPFFVSLEPHVERPEESVKIANVNVSSCSPAVRSAAFNLPKPSSLLRQSKPSTSLVIYPGKW
jgi:hypothetical protein